MLNDFSSSLQNFGLAFVPALFGIICHEVAHGWAAWKQGDPTAKMLGRLTLNPIKHIDPVGFGVFAFTALMPGSFVFGWAKPVPVQPRYFRRPREGMMLVSLAGPVANILVAILCALIIKLLFNLAQAQVLTASPAIELIVKSAEMGVIINCSLAVFNLLPIPPLDGSHILGGLLPQQLAYKYESLGRYGMMLVILFIVVGGPSLILWPIVKQIISGIATITGLS